MTDTTLGIVIPIYNEAETLPELGRRLATVCDELEGIDWRVLYVNDGSTDGSHQMILHQHRHDPRFGLIDLSRNFGHQAAITAGINHVDTDVVVLMDGDLQDPPEVIPGLIETWREGGEVVRAVRTDRKESGLRRLGFALFHRTFRWISDLPILPNTGIFCLLDRRALAALDDLSESNRYLPGLQSWIGFDQRVVEYVREDRAHGEPKQTFTRLFKYAADGVFSFSYKPLRLLTLGGAIICVLGLILALVFIIRRLAGVEIAETGFTTLVTLSLFFGGVQLVSVGLIGEYVARIYDEVKERPMYLVRSAIGVTGGTRGEEDRASRPAARGGSREREEVQSSARD